MIELAETIGLDGDPLSAAEYAAIQDIRLDPSNKVVIERYTPLFDWHPTEYFKSRGDDNLYDGGSLHSAASSTTGLVRCWIASGTLWAEYMRDETDGNQTWSTPVSVATGVESVPPSMYFGRIGGEEHVSIFYVKLSGIYSHIYWTVSKDYGATWQTPVAASSFLIEDVFLIAAAHENMVFFLGDAPLASDDNTRLYMIENSGSWAAPSWSLTNFQPMGFPFTPSSFEAFLPKDAWPEMETWRKSYIGQVFLYIGMDLPPYLSLRGEGDSVERIGYRREGIVGVTYDSHREELGDIFLVDVFDMAMEDDQRRLRPKVARLGDLLFMVLSCIDVSNASIRAGAIGEHEAIRYLYSRDGIHWSKGQLAISTSEDPGTTKRGASKYSSILGEIEGSPYIYLFNNRTTHRAYRTRLMGTPADEIIYEVTHDIAKIKASNGGVRQTEIVIENVNGDAATFLSGGGAFICRTFLGRWNGSSQVCSLVATEFIDVIRISTPTPDQSVVSITLRDAMSRLIDIKADHVREFNAQIAGVDHFFDLKHVSGHSGTWTIEAGNAIHMTGNAEDDLGVAYLTWGTDLRDYEMRIAFKLDPTATGERYAGIVFRGIDADNYYAICYVYDPGEPEHDRFYMQKTEGGVAGAWESLSGGGTLSWTTDTWYYLRIIVRHQTMKLYISTDGITYTKHAATIVLDGETYIPVGPYDVMASVPWQSGYVGMLAKTGGDEKYIKFDKNYIADTLRPLTMESAILAIGVYAGITKFDFESTMMELPDEEDNDDKNKFDTGTPVASTGTWSVAAYDPGSGTQDWLLHTAAGSPVSDYEWAWYEDEVGRNFVLEFITDCEVGEEATVGFCMTYGYYGLALKWDGTNVKLVKMEGAQAHTTLYSIPDDTDEFKHIRIHVREEKYDYASSESEWIFVSVYINDVFTMFHAVHHDDIVVGDYLLFGSIDSGWARFRAIRIPELKDEVRYVSLDPGQAVMSSVNQAIRDLQVELLARFDGSLRARLIGGRTATLSLDHASMEDQEIIIDRRRNVSQMRMVGGFDSIDVLDPLSIEEGWGEGFEVYHNPDLLSSKAIQAMSDSVIYFRYENRRRGVFAIKGNPLLELGDRISTADDGDFTIESMNENVGPADYGLNLNCRQYDERRDA